MPFKSNEFSLFLDYGIDFDERRIFLHHEMTSGERPGQSVNEHVIRGLLELDKNEGDIELWINTPGGNINDMFAIHDVMLGLENNVKTLAFGEVASAGCLLLAAGDVRLATPNAWFMAHEPELELEGSLSYCKRLVDSVADMWYGRWAELMSTYTSPKKDKKFWKKVFKTKPELYLDAQGMLEHGIVDEILNGQ
jgi:ATP-dependent Clp protease protease subunit